MNENLQFIFKTIAAVVTSEKLPDVPERADWRLIYEICDKHNIANIFAYAANNYSVLPENIKQAFLKRLQMDVMLDAAQSSEKKRIFDKLEEMKLNYMPVKGTIIKKMYPSADMRRMSDIDILTQTGMEEEYKKAMLELGYQFIRNKQNEYVFRKSIVTVELHRYLITPGNDDLFSYYDTGWRLANKKTEYRYELSCEEEFIYIIAHFVKHYRNAGSGIKPLIDLWLYKKNNDMNMDYVNEQLRKMNLTEFSNNLFRLVKVWFEGAEADDKMLEMTEFIVNSGEYGSLKNSNAANAVREKYNEKSEKMTKLKLWLKMIFLNRKGMAKKYPILNKAPLLLPFFWIYRIFDIILFNRSKIKQQKNGVEDNFGDNVKRYDEHMKNVGLDIYSGKNDTKGEK